MITGGAGFIGSHLCQQLLASNHTIVILDNFDPFYDPAIKRNNVRQMEPGGSVQLIEADIRDSAGMHAAVSRAAVSEADVVVHLAARAGVRPSIREPILYSQVNLDGTVAVLELARRIGAQRFVFGSSSSVYGNNSKVPFSEDDPVERPISPYAATKRAGELLCHAYHHLYGMSIVCLRFFTVYGPRQRPDLAIHKFAKLMTAGQPIPVYGDGSTERDYTYVNDIVQGIEGAIAYTGSGASIFEIVNLGESATVPLSRLVSLLAEALDVSPEIKRLPPQPGDVVRTCADIRKARALLGYAPKTQIEEGIPKFVEWFRRTAD